MAGYPLFECQVLKPPTQLTDSGQMPLFDGSNGNKVLDSADPPNVVEGALEEYIMTFTVEYSEDAATWTSVDSASGGGSAFTANTNGVTRIANEFAGPQPVLSARYGERVVVFVDV